MTNAPFDRNVAGRGLTTIRLAVVFYGATLAGALVWNAFAGHPWWRLFWIPGRATAAHVVVAVAAGAGLGAITVALSRLAVERFRWGRELYHWFATLLGPIGWRDALLLATLSSVGEETLFRGAMQPSLGLVWTTLLFGLLHVPPRLRLAGWTLTAALLGLCFGLLVLWSGNLAGAMVAHFVVNFFNLRHITDFVAGACEDADLMARPDGT